MVRVPTAGDAVLLAILMPSASGPRSDRVRSCPHASDWGGPDYCPCCIQIVAWPTSIQNESPCWNCRSALSGAGRAGEKPRKACPRASQAAMLLTRPRVCPSAAAIAIAMIAMYLCAGWLMKLTM